MLSYIRKFVYKKGFRPKPGTPLYSPTLHLHYAWLDAVRDSWLKNFRHHKTIVVTDDMQMRVEVGETE